MFGLIRSTAAVARVGLSHNAIKVHRVKATWTQSAWKPASRILQQNSGNWSLASVRTFSTEEVDKPIETGKDGVEEEPVETFLAYEGPFSPILKILKRVSIFSCGCTMIGVPILAVFGNPDMQLVQRVAVGVTTVGVAMGTTALLHTVASPYARSIIISVMPSGKQAMEIETFTLFGNPKLTVVPDMTKLTSCPERYFSTFKDPVSNRYFYIHDDWDKTVFYDRQFYEEIMAISEKPVAPETEQGTSD